MMQSKRKGLFAVLSTLLALALSVFAATPAFAAGTTGDLTVNGVSKDDQVYIYKIVDVTKNSDQTLTYSWHADYGVGDIDAYVALTSDSQDIKDIANKIAASDKLGAATKTATATGDSVVFEGLEAGEYLVKVVPASGKVVYQHSIANIAYVANSTGDGYTVSDGSIDAKNSPLNLDKTADGEDKPTKNTSKYSVGQVIPYTVEVDIPQYPENAINKKFTLGDTMTNLQFNNDLTAKVGETSVLDKFTLTPATDGFTLAIKADDADDFFATCGGQKLVLTYGGKITDAAITNGTGKNEITLTFAPNPFDNNSSDTIKDDVDNSLFGVEVEKVDADNGNIKLQGAEFTVYTDKECTTPLTLNDDTAVTLTTDANGHAETDKVFGEEGTFYVKETKAPAGYVLSSDVHTVTFKATKSVDNDGPVHITIDGDKDNDLKLELTVTNAKQPGLPSTGGTGTVALTVAGVLLMAGAGAFVLGSRKAED